MEANDFGKMLLKYPWILSRSILQNYENILIFFDDEKVSILVTILHMRPSFSFEQLVFAMKYVWLILMGKVIATF